MDAHEGETIYLNATIHTMDAGRPRAEALLVRGDRIAAVGTREEVVSQARGARSVDLEGRTMIPGFNDSHAHLLPFGLTLQQVDVSADAVHSLAEIVRAVEDRVRTTALGEWVIGTGYNQNELREGRHPTKVDLDPVSPRNPVVLHHTSGHVLTCNSEALKRAGITRDSGDPPGGEIDRDEHCDPTGLLKESAMELLRRVIPEPTIEEGKAAILRAVNVLAGYGITSASDASTGHGDSIEPELAMYRGALNSGTLPIRITLMPQIAYVTPPESDKVRDRSSFDVGDRPQWLGVGATKIFSDGALSTRTAAMRRPYADDPSNHGILLWQREALISTMRRAHAAGWQIATHALGDRAVEMALDCYATAMRDRPRPDHRHRIEHCMYADLDLAQRIKQLGIVPSLQPDIYRLGDAYIAALGVDRARESIPVGLFRRLGVEYAFSSDLPVIPGNPLDVVRSAMERRTPGGIVLQGQHAVSALEAIGAYTRGGAYATHSERDRGTLRPGMLADLTVLSGDPAVMSLQHWDELRVMMTVVGGTVSYQS
ncbi:MAG TPA: amidohydrolase [Chloroflexota bacterium]